MIYRRQLHVHPLPPPGPAGRGRTAHHSTRERLNPTDTFNRQLTPVVQPHMVDAAYTIIRPGYCDIEAPASSPPRCAAAALTPGRAARAHVVVGARVLRTWLSVLQVRTSSRAICENSASHVRDDGGTHLAPSSQCVYLDDPCVCESQRVTVQARMMRLDA